ncbi:MAG: hypothetical protein ACRC4T_15510 [Cetobacterium sp.]
MEKIQEIVIYKLKVTEELIKNGHPVKNVEINRKYNEGLCFRFERNDEVDKILIKHGVLSQKHAK